MRPTRAEAEAEAEAGDVLVETQIVESVKKKKRVYRMSGGARSDCDLFVPRPTDRSNE